MSWKKHFTAYGTQGPDSMKLSSAQIKAGYLKFTVVNQSVLKDTHSMIKWTWTAK